MLSTAVHEYDIVIKEHHLDTFGHVNNAVYLELFEEARWDMITRNGYGYAEILATQLAPALLEVSMSFKRELRNRQGARIRSWMESHQQRIGRMTQVIVDLADADKIYCEAKFAFGLMDLRTRKLVAPTPAWWRAMGLPDSPPGDPPASG